MLSGEGKNFCAGIDTASLEADFVKPSTTAQCPGRARERLLHKIKSSQHTITAIEKCRWPVIAAVQGTYAEASILKLSKDSHFIASGSSPHSNLSLAYTQSALNCLQLPSAVALHLSNNCTLRVPTSSAGACFGAGVDIITACDIRYSTGAATFCVKVSTNHGI